MPCLRPIAASQDSEGTVQLHHRSNPRLDALQGDRYMEVGCGQCLACRAKRAREWAIRCHHEAQTSTQLVDGIEIPNGCFITLTYDDEHLPEDGSLDKTHFQNFMKRLRHDSPNKIRFLHCGEYGPSGGRPHHHACLFGEDFSSDRLPWKREGHQITFLSDRLSALWGNGFTTIAPLSYATAAYTAGYVVKKLKADDWEQSPHASYVDTSTGEVRLRLQEYNTMSRKPGLGTEWFNRYWQEVYPADVVHIEGKTFRPPRFYDRLLEETAGDVYIDVMEQRRKFVEAKGPTSELELRARGRNFVARYGNTHQRNKVK